MTDAATEPVVCSRCRQGRHAGCVGMIANADYTGRCGCSCGGRPAAPAAPVVGTDAQRAEADVAGPRKVVAFPSPVEWLEENAPTSDAVAVAELRDEQVALAAEASAARWRATCPARFADATWDQLERPAEIVGELHAWRDAAVAGADGNLLLCGPVGVGKTLASILLARDLHDAGKRVRFCPVVELFDQLRPDGKGDAADFTRPDVLILDDLGSEKSTDWVSERLYVIVNRRWLDRRPTIVTSNLTKDSLPAAIGQRCFDRLRDDGVLINLDGESHRRGRA